MEKRREVVKVSGELAVTFSDGVTRVIDIDDEHASISIEYGSVTQEAEGRRVKAPNGRRRTTLRTWTGMDSFDELDG